MQMMGATNAHTQVAHMQYHTVVVYTEQLRPTYHVTQLGRVGLGRDRPEQERRRGTRTPTPCTNTTPVQTRMHTHRLDTMLHVLMRCDSLYVAYRAWVAGARAVLTHARARAHTHSHSLTHTHTHTHTVSCLEAVHAARAAAAA
jgi:hypothetical protein